MSNAPATPEIVRLVVEAVVNEAKVVVALVVVEFRASNPTKWVLVEEANSPPWNHIGVVVAEDVSK